jgi:hypothetical protein
MRDGRPAAGWPGQRPDRGCRVIPARPPAAAHGDDRRPGPGVPASAERWIRQDRRTKRMPPGICTTGEIGYAPVPRAVADAVRWMGDDREARALVAAAVQQGYCPLPLLAEELDAGPVRGSARLRGVLAEVTGGIRSIAEADFLELIRRARLPVPVLNPRLYAGDTFIAAPDCWCRRRGSRRRWTPANGTSPRVTGNARWPGTTG